MEKPIWFGGIPADVADMNKLGVGNMGAFLGMLFTEIGPDFLKGTMPVNERTRQPYGLLHGGASAAFAETLGSVASAMVIDHTQYYCVGLEINANHVRSASKGLVTGVCKSVHLGRTTHVWDIRIFDEREKLVCISRLTVAIIRRSTAAG
jgi:1,4-dihydroxy-2-naphthoyl-CoA hydrolase